MARAWRESGLLIDPHTAVGVRAARAALARDPKTPVIALATAHPAKFPETVKAATGMTPPPPHNVSGLARRAERFDPVAANVEAAPLDFIAHRPAIGQSIHVFD